LIKFSDSAKKILVTTGQAITAIAAAVFVAFVVSSIEE